MGNALFAAGSSERTSGLLGPRTARLILVCCLPLLALLYTRATTTPLALDDYAQRAMIEGTRVPARSPLDLYDFVDDSSRGPLIDRGNLPWWVDRGARARFLRPLPSLLVWLDFKLFGYRSFGPHVLSLAWWIAATVGVHEVLLRMLSPAAALMGAVVFGAMSCHVVPVVWLADRDILVAEAFGLLAFGYHLRSRAGEGWRSALAGAGLWALALLTGEYALSWGGYVVALELCGPKQSARSRVRAVGAFALPALAYLVVHISLHYGAAGTAFYCDPIRDPLGYLARAPLGLATLLGALWVGVDVERFAMEPASAVLPATVAGAVVLVLAVVTIFRKRDRAELRSILTLLVGSALALLPVLAAEPKPRLLGVAAVGASGVVGGLLGAALDGLRPGPGRPRVTFEQWLVVAVLALVHLVRMPATVFRFAAGMRADAIESERRVAEVPALLTASVKTVVVLRASVLPSVLWTPCALRAAPDVRWFVSSQTFSEVDAVRTGDRELEVSRPDGAPLAPGEGGNMFRSMAMRAGDEIAIDGIRIHVLATNTEQRPTKVRYVFDRRLDAADLLWIDERGSGFQQVGVPPVGYGVRLAR